ncbi:hypothetical protein ACRRTK_010924 [Alexandromys fortis]
MPACTSIEQAQIRDPISLPAVGNFWFQILICCFPGLRPSGAGAVVRSSVRSDATKKHKSFQAATPSSCTDVLIRSQLMCR